MRDTNKSFGIQQEVQYNSDFLDEIRKLFMSCGLCSEGCLWYSHLFQQAVDHHQLHCWKTDRIYFVLNNLQLIGVGIMAYIVSNRLISLIYKHSLLIYILNCLMCDHFAQIHSEISNNNQHKYARGHLSPNVLCTDTCQHWP